MCSKKSIDLLLNKLLVFRVAINNLLLNAKFVSNNHKFLNIFWQQVKKCQNYSIIFLFHVFTSISWYIECQSKTQCRVKKKKKKKEKKKWRMQDWLVWKTKVWFTKTCSFHVQHQFQPIYWNNCEHKTESFPTNNDEKVLKKGVLKLTGL